MSLEACHMLCINLFEVICKLNGSIVMLSNVHCAIGWNCEPSYIWWSKHERQFPTIVYLKKENLSIYDSHIETKKLFLL